MTPIVQLTIRVPPDLKTGLDQTAARYHVSVNALAVHLLDAALDTLNEADLTNNEETPS